VRALSTVAGAGVEPDLYVLLEVPAEVAAVRLGADRDRMESAGDDFHDRVRRGYAELARAEGWLVVDGSGTPEEVERLVAAAVAARLDP
jgi:dTMP kinase